MQDSEKFTPEEAQRANDAQIAESGMPVGASLETQLAAAEAKAESSSSSAEARLGLQVAERQVAGLNTTEVVGARAKLALNRIESMLSRRSDRLGLRADNARRAKEKHNNEAQKIRDKWSKISESRLKTEVVSQLAAGIDRDIKVRRGKLKEAGEFVQSGFDKLKTWYQESRTRVNAKKETQRGKASERYKVMADKINTLSNSIREEIGELAGVQETILRQAENRAAEQQAAAQKSKTDADERFDTSMTSVDILGKVGKSGVLSKDQGDIEGQREVVDRAANEIVDLMNPQQETPAAEFESQN